MKTLLANYHNGAEKNVRVSVVIPCYNQGEYILDAIHSVEQINEQIYEIVIVNDGSTDELTLNVFSQLQTSGYHIINQENLGLAQARNHGIEASKGEYILTLDADNKIRSNYLIESIKILNSHPEIGVVYGNSQWFGEKNQVFEVPDFDLDRLILGNFIDACAVFRKQLWHDCEGYDPNMPIQGYEDWDFWLSAAEIGWKFYHIPEITFDYRVRSGSMVSFCNIPDNRRALMYYICNKHINLYRDKLAYVLSQKESTLLTEQINASKFYAELLEVKHNCEQLEQDFAQQLEAEIARSQSHLQQKDLELARSQLQSQEIQTELARSQSQLHNLQAELDLSRSQLQQTQAKLEQTTFELQQTIGKLQQTQADLGIQVANISAMESSKFWKLRTAWLSLKRIVGIKTDA